MSNIDNIKRKVKQIERLLLEVKIELEKLDKEKPSKPKKSVEEEKLPSVEELKHEYEKLYDAISRDNISVMEEFIESKGKKYLKVFCEANNLPINISSVSKKGIVKEVSQSLLQRRAITKKAI